MKKHQIIVLGGGFTGCAAAIAAARQGCDVLLIEQSGYLGGAATNCLVNPFMQYWTTVEKNGEKERLYLSRGIFEEIVEKLTEMGAYGHWQCFHEEYLKLLLDQMVSEAGVQVLFHSVLCETSVDNGNLTSLTVVNKAGKQTFCADTFIDCTGDADLAVMAGCPYHLGRPGDQLCQPMTLCFRLANVDLEGFRNGGNELAQKLYKQWQAEGKTSNPRENILTFGNMVDGVLHFNTTRVVKHNPVDPFDVSRAEMEARKQAFELYHLLKENVPCFAKADFLISAPWIGARESRMIDGEYLLTQEDLKACTRFDDAIAAGNYDIDIHNPEGSGTSHYYFPAGQYYTIPYRSLQPKNLDNLLVAGRCISSTHEAQASYRIMPIVCTLGEAAGVAAAVSCKANVGVKQADIREIQRILKENNAFLGE